MITNNVVTLFRKVGIVHTVLFYLILAYRGTYTGIETYNYTVGVIRTVIPIDVKRKIPMLCLAYVALSLVLPAAPVAPSWEALQASVLATSTGAHLENVAKQRKLGLGAPHHAATHRLFGSGSEPRVTLYRDTAAWCPYCQRVWIFLEEKQIPYRVETIPLNAYGYKPVWYSKRVDGGKLPAIELDGKMHVESRKIMELLEAEFPQHGPSMVPRVGSHLAARLEGFEDLCETLVGDWFSLVFYPVEGEAALDRARAKLLSSLGAVDKAIGATSGPWALGGDEPSIADVCLITDLERMVRPLRASNAFSCVIIHAVARPVTARVVVRVTACVAPPCSRSCVQQPTLPRL